METGPHPRTAIKVIVKLSPSNHQAMKTYGGVEVQLHALLTSALDVGQMMVSFMPQALYPRYPFDKMLGALQSQSKCCGEGKKILYPCRESNPGRLTTIFTHV